MKTVKKILLKIIALMSVVCLLPVCACKEEEETAHVHTYSDKWSYDAEYHWQEPTCGDTNEPRGKSIHNYIKGKCSLCGYEPNPKEPGDDSPDPWTPSDPPDTDKDPDVPDDNDNDEDEPWIEPEEPGDVAGSMTLGATEHNGFDYTELIDESGRLAGYSVAAGSHIDESMVTVPSSYKDKPVLRISGRGFANATMRTISLPDTLLAIGQLAFESCTNLAYFTMPANVETMDDMAFYNCTALKTFDFSQKLKGIYYRNFYQCENIESLTLPDSLTEIGGMAFQGCTSLRVLTFGKNIEFIGEQAFKDCNSLTTLKVPDIKSYCSIQMDYSSDSMPSFHVRHLIDLSKSSEDYVTELHIEGVENIIDRLFGNLIDLKRVTVGAGVKTIGKECFVNCIALESIQFGDDVEKIGGLALSGCIKLTEVTLPDKLTSIDFRLFGGCSALETVTIGSNVTAIGREVFLQCNKLMNINFKGSKEEWDAIEKDYAWDSMMPKIIRYHFAE